MSRNDPRERSLKIVRGTSSSYVTSISIDEIGISAAGTRLAAATTAAAAAASDANHLGTIASMVEASLRFHSGPWRPCVPVHSDIRRPMKEAFFFPSDSFCRLS